eukprot:TRINITY_DN4252_c8_g1_i1.p1 TRINITY_DN4252_c8_g1~~TRINITY_DN4252_c8_g1_i1.p1  ORF type:complete len:283 (+),score=39.05 TRINITY_DN4252_c8_g1_i1:39-887(+)
MLKALWKYPCPVLISLLVIAYWFLCYYVYIPAMNRQSEEWRNEQLMFATFEVVIVMYCLWQCALVHAGRIPKGWNGTNEEPHDTRAVWCKKCLDWKPPRTHHCSHCQSCIARYDHHCLWVGNCVGQRNHKFFVLFLFYITVCIVHQFFMTYHYMSSSGREEPYLPLGAPLGFKETRIRYTYREPVWLKILLVVYGLVAFGFLLFAGSFLWGTSRNVCNNQTTYDESVVTPESMFGVNRFDRGWFSNIGEVLGKHPLMWLIPTSTPVTVPLHGSKSSFEKKVE